MTYEEKMKLALDIRKGMVVDPVIPEGFETYLERVECKEMWIPTSQGKSHLYMLKEKGKTGILPLYINIHGGGFVRPHMDRDILFASRITCEAECLTLDLDYRLAPEYPYPAAVDECYEMVRWAVLHAKELGIDPKRIAVGGHSSGGTLTAALALKVNQTKEFQICLQILDYPPMDMYTDPADKPSDEGKVIDPARARAYNALYVSDREQAKEPLASPVFATEEMLKGLPDALVITAGKDNLRFEAEQYAAKLVAAGVRVTAQRILESRHGFMTHCRDNYEEGHRLYIDSLRNAFATA